MIDYRITAPHGEVIITSISERAQKARGIKIGHSIVFKSAEDARPYVQVAEAEGLTFEGKELLAA
jgi:hypothetical protein